MRRPWMSISPVCPVKALSKASNASCTKFPISNTSWLEVGGPAVKREMTVSIDVYATDRQMETDKQTIQADRQTDRQTQNKYSVIATVSQKETDRSRETEDKYSVILSHSLCLTAQTLKQEAH